MRKISRIGIACAAAIAALYAIHKGFPTFSHHAERLGSIMLRAALLRGSGTLALGDSRLSQSHETLSCAGERYVNAGMAGYTIEDEHWLAAVLSTIARPRRVVLAAGINNAYPPIPFDANRAAEEMRFLADSFATHGAEVYVVSLVPNAAGGQIYGGAYYDRTRFESIESALRAPSAHFVDVTAAMTDGGGNLRDALTSDGLHYSPDGDAAWTVAVKVVLCGK